MESKTIQIAIDLINGQLMFLPSNYQEQWLHHILCTMLYQKFGKVISPTLTCEPDVFYYIKVTKKHKNAKKTPPSFPKMPEVFVGYVFCFPTRKVCEVHVPFVGGFSTSPLPSLKLTASSPLKIGRDPKGNSSSNHWFLGVSTRC